MSERTPAAYCRQQVEDRHHDEIFIGYMGYPKVQSSVIEGHLREDYPGLQSVEQALGHPVVAATWQAFGRMERFVTEPRLHDAPVLSAQRGCDVALERLDEQPIRSFKAFGPANAISLLTTQERSRGIITASAGNHAQGVAMVCNQLGIDATVVMPKYTPAVKIEATHRHGAKVILKGDTYTDAYHYSEWLRQETGATNMPAFDSEPIMTGNAVAAVFAVLQRPNMTHWYGPVGGGGYMGATARFVKAINPGIETVGVQVEGSDAMVQALNHGHPVELKQVDTFSDGTAVKRVGNKTFAVVQKYVDRMLVVTKEQLMDGMLALREETGGYAEPAGALAVAGLLCDPYLANRPDAVAVASVTGRNISAEKVKELTEYAASRPSARTALGYATLQVA